MLEVTRLSKTFGKRQAVRQLSFQVNAGDVVGFLGPNGAGKSTSMKMLSGFLAPCAGQIRLQGLDMQRQRRPGQQRLGYLPEGAPAYGEMSVVDFLRFIGQIRGLRGQQLQIRLDQLQQQLSLDQVRNQRIDTLSKGFVRRVGLAQAIIHQPPLLLLDEPTDGLDPNQKHQVRELISRLATNCTIIISTHILDEVSALCNRVLLLHQGRLLVDETTEQFLSRAPAELKCNRSQALDLVFRQLTTADIA